ncbi:ABC transporter [Janibacter sp. Soil728]|uniref:ABC transporter permease n=1 Tax=Janibacter sp. Soil728 TaxID=1736393 RepID=UPI0006F80C6C|nr:ABC transporter permease [Janibacter sp. Soil728]KRE35505.1 ABC transporter [Janibacter sp. Soil728]
MTSVEYIEQPTVRTEYVDARGLVPVGRRPSLHDYIADLWRRRSFIVADSRAKSATSNKDYLLGNLWLVGRPLLDGLTYFVIFGLIFGARDGVENFVGFLLIGIFLFGYTSRCLTGGLGSIASGKNLIRTFAFPRAVVPLASTLREMLSTFPVIVTMIVLILVIPPHARLSIWWLLFPAVFLLQTLFNIGVGLYAARFGALVPDAKVAISFISRLWMYGSGVMFSIEQISDGHPLVMAISQLNPLYCVLELSRDLLLYEKPGDATLWVVLTAWAVVTPVMGFIFFWHGEEHYGRE